MYQFKHGFGPGEPFATHARRRYRLLPSKFANPGAPTPDGALWIIHYSSAEPNDRIPSNLILPGDVRAQQMQQTRTYLQTQGQITQKEFMLHDRANWPQVQLPRSQGRAPSYPGSMAQTRTPQAMAYPPHPVGNTGPSSKRARTQVNSNAPPPGGGVLPLESAADDEENTARGDEFDQITPRDVSTSRYKQNHEWMEEVLLSPYAVGQILPVDLGLGLRGDLGKLTDGIFYPPPSGAQWTNDGKPTKDEHQYAYVGKLDEGKAEEFRKRTNDYIAESKSEIEKMKAKHAKRMAKFKKGGLICEAEKQLRNAVQNPDDVGTEYWRLEGKIDEDETDTDVQAAPPVVGKVDDIVAQVEASLGRHTAAVQELRRLQDGGLEDSQASPSAHSEPASGAVSVNGSQRSGVLINDEDLDIGGSAAGLLDQFHTGLSAASTPGNSFPTPQAQSQGAPATGTPNDAHSPQPPTDSSITQSAVLDAAAVAQQDATMAGMDVDEPAKPDENAETSDWVVVEKEGNSPPNTSQPQETTSASSTTAGAAVTGATESTTTAAPEAPAPAAASEQMPAADAAVGQTFDISHDTNLAMDLPDSFTADPTDFSGLEDLDTAGDALAGFGSHGGNDGHDDVLRDAMDLGLDLEMDDSAFGDAFHGVEAHREDGNGEGDGL